MKKLSLLIAVFGLFAVVGIASASTANTIQPAETVTYSENVAITSPYTMTVGGAGYFQGGLHIDSVTFFNGTAVNNTTNAEGEGNPFTVGDDMRVDGRVWRGATAGPEADGSMPFIINDNVQILGTLTMVNSSEDSNDESDDSDTTTVTVGDITSVVAGGGISVSNGSSGDATVSVATGGINTTRLADNAVTSDKIVDETIVSADINDGTIANADIANDAINSAKIENETITTDDIDDLTVATADLADDAVTSKKINNGTIVGADVFDGTITGTDISNNSIGNDDVAGPGGSNLPTAYGHCTLAGGRTWGTSNFTCAQNGGVYVIEITGVDLADESYVAIVTSDTDSYIPATTNSGGNLEITFIDGDGVSQTPSFSFVVYTQ